MGVDEGWKVAICGRDVWRGLTSPHHPTPKGARAPRRAGPPH